MSVTFTADSLSETLSIDVLNKIPSRLSDAAMLALKGEPPDDDEIMDDGHHRLTVDEDESQFAKLMRYIRALADGSAKCHLASLDEQERQELKHLADKWRVVDPSRHVSFNDKVNEYSQGGTGTVGTLHSSTTPNGIDSSDDEPPRKSILASTCSAERIRHRTASIDDATATSSDAAPQTGDVAAQTGESDGDVVLRLAKKQFVPNASTANGFILRQTTLNIGDVQELTLLAARLSDEQVTIGGLPITSGLQIKRFLYSRLRKAGAMEPSYTSPTF